MVDLLVGHQELRLFPPTIGKFENGRGEFFGDDVEGGKPVRVRFHWTGGERPRWEQAMSADGGKTWEKNWVMRFERGVRRKLVFSKTVNQERGVCR